MREESKRVTIFRWGTDANIDRVSSARVGLGDVGGLIQGRGIKLTGASRGICEVPQTCSVSLDDVDSASGVHHLGNRQGNGGMRIAINDWTRCNACGQHG